MTDPQGIDRLDPKIVEGAVLMTLNLSDRTLGLIRESLDTRRAEAARTTDTGDLAVTPGVIETADRSVDVRIYRPAAAGLLPGLVFFHSGALVLGNLDTDHARCIALARQAGCVVVSVDYRLAPEAPYPAALDDCAGAVQAIYDRAESYGVDPARLAVGGSSAGAGLAAAVALHARDNAGPPLCFQLLHQPMLDASCSSASMREFLATPGFDANSAKYAWACYLQGQPASAYASPAHAELLAGLPPAYIACSEVDPLRDEAIEYAQRLVQAAVPTELHLIPATGHGFDSMVPEQAVSLRAIADQSAALAAAFAG